MEYQLELQLDATAFIICYIGIVTNAALSHNRQASTSDKSGITPQECTNLANNK
ncbi:MAG: hypothetical protein IKI25_07200 [Bacteroidales bacterium]|nr:hypothetical protein [Bacteroidales bacterium]MBR7035525.1 hypothetical protein [Bacteroidales bacterium]